MIKGLLLCALAIAVYGQASPSVPVNCPYNSRESCPTATPASIFFSPTNNNLLPQGVTATYSANVNCSSIVNGFTPSLTQITSIQSAAVSTVGTTITGRYPANPNTLTQGVYQFTLYGDTLCGRVASTPVTVVARCPLPPTAVVSALASDGTALPSVNGVFQVRRGVNFLIVGQNSFATQFILPGNVTAPVPNTASSFTITTSAWAATNTPSAQFIDANGVAVCPTAAPCACRSISGQSSGTTTNCLNTLVRVNNAGTATFTLTVGDGCSSASATITVAITCGCSPTPRASAFPTVWTDLAQTGQTRPIASTLNNLWGATWNAQNPAFTLTGSSSFIYDVPNTDLGYDWNFVSWIPDYSARFGSQTYAQLTNFVAPTTGASCSTTAGPGSATTGCWTSANIVGTLPARTGSFQYIATMDVTPAASANDVRQWTTGARTKTYRFWRYAPSTCTNTNNPGVPVVTSTSTANTTTVAYNSFPTFTDNVGDFNGFQTNGVAFNNRFRPSTEFQITRQTTTNVWSTTTTSTQTATSFTCPAGLQDLAYCTVTIEQNAGATPSYSQTGASLRISSFGACKGVWTFALQVSDGCNQPVSDPFTFNVGCNRSPQVQAGCSTSQTWSGSSFNQISLDGRATTDPDNFGDAFNNLAAINNNRLLFAWSLMSAPGGYNGESSSTWGTCPLVVQSSCAEDYCANGNSIAYYRVDPSNGQGADGTIVVAAPNQFSGSVQGGVTTQDSWSDGFAVRIFPTFNPNCAPTVYPRVFQNGQLCTTTACGGVGNQEQHIGNTAFVAGVVTEGTYVFRLSAFDGCTVGSADVSVQLTCPLLAISSTTLFTVGNQAANTITLTTASSGTFATSEVLITYRGLSSVTVTYAYTLTSSTGVVTNGPTGSVTQNVRIPSVNVNIPSAPGTYTLTLRVSDGCQRTATVSPLVGTVNVVCLANPSGINLIVSPLGQLGVAYQSNVNLFYTNVSTTATFPSLVVNVNGVATNSSNLPVSGQTLTFDFTLTRDGVAVVLPTASLANVAVGVNATITLGGAPVSCTTSSAFNGWNFCVNPTCQSATGATTVFGAGVVNAPGTYVLSVLPRLTSLTSCVAPAATFTFVVGCNPINTPNVQVASATGLPSFSSLTLVNDIVSVPASGALVGSWGTSGNTINDLSPSGSGGVGLPTVNPFQYVLLAPFGTTGGVLPNNAIVSWSVQMTTQDLAANPLNLVAAPVRTAGVNNVGFASVVGSTPATASTGFLVNGGGLVTCAQAQFWPTFPGTWTVSLSVMDGCAMNTRSVNVIASCNSTLNAGVTITAASYYTAAQTSVVQPTLVGNTLNVFWDSYNVLPVFTQSSQRNFNGIGQVFIFNYGDNENYFGAFPALNVSSVARSTNRYTVWYSTALQGGVSYCSYGSFAGCTAIPNQMGYYGFSGNSATWTGTGIPLVGQSLLSQNNLGFQLNLTMPGTYNYLAISWNGAVGSSCYTSSNVVVVAQCNSLTGPSGQPVPGVTTSADSVGMNSYFDGSLFGLVDMTGSFVYTQQGCPTCPTTSGFGTGNLFSLQYVWEVLNSPANSIFGMANGGVSLTSVPGSPVVVAGSPVSTTNSSGTFSSTTTVTTVTTANTAVNVAARLLNHNFNTPRTCFRPDVEGAYTVRLTVRDGCMSWVANPVTINARCNGLPAFTGGAAGAGVAAFSLTSVSNTNPIAIGTGATSVSVQGSTNDRITISSNLQAPVLNFGGAPTSGDVYFYSWTVTNGAGAVVSVTNSQGPTISFLPEQLATTDIPALSNAQTYTVSLRVSNNCPTPTGVQTTTYTFTLNVRCLVDSSIASSLTTTSVNVVNVTSGTVVTSVSPYCVPGSTFCGSSGFANPAGQPTGVPTIVYQSTATQWGQYRFEITGTFNSPCQVRRLSWYLTSVGCSLPYVPMTMVPPPPPTVACVPSVSSYWTILDTPCKVCPTDPKATACDFQGWEGRQSSYVRPNFVDSQSNSISYCAYSNNRRLASTPSNTLYESNFCGISGVGLEYIQTSGGVMPLFKANFPGQYIIGYTIVDGCNPPIQQNITITARCVTRATSSVVTPSSNSDFFCNGNPTTNQATAPGAFQSLNIGNFVSATTSSPVTGATVVTQVSSSACPVVARPMTCDDFNSAMTAPNTLESCCRCKFGAVSINVGATTSASTTPSTGIVTSPGSATSAGSSNPSGESTPSLAVQDDAEFRRNQQILIGVIVPLSFILVCSVAFNFIMVSKLKSAGQMFSVRAGDVELSTSPSSRQDV